MKKVKVQKPYVKPVLEMMNPAKAEAMEALGLGVVETPKEPETEAPPPSPPPSPVRSEGPKVRYARVTAFLSISLHLSHEEMCMKVGKCFCESTASGRVGATWHLIAGVPQVVPMVWTTHPLIQSMQRSGKVVVKVLT